MTNEFSAVSRFNEESPRRLMQAAEMNISRLDVAIDLSGHRAYRSAGIGDPEAGRITNGKTPRNEEEYRTFIIAAEQRL